MTDCLLPSAEQQARSSRPCNNPSDARSSRPVSEARAILGAVEHRIKGNKSDDLLDLYDTLHRWVERARRPM